MESKVVLTFN